MFYHLNEQNIELKYSNYFNDLETIEKNKIVSFLNKKFSTNYRDLSEFLMLTKI